MGLMANITARKHLDGLMAWQQLIPQSQVLCAKTKSYMTF